MDDDVRCFIDAYLEFADTARSNIGYDESQFKLVCESLRALKPKFQETGYVPNEVANVFIDLFGALESASHRHNEELAQKLRYAADELAGIAREVTFTPDE